jgi:hypothetical protein
MAFPSAAGYTNLPNGVFVPVIYSQKVLKFFRKESVIEAVTNTDYYGEIENMGDTVRIIKEPVVNITPYRRGIDLVDQDLIDEDLTLTVDQGNTFRFSVEDIEEKQSHINWQQLATSSGAYALKDNYDSSVLSHITSNVDSSMLYGSTGSPIGVGFSAGRITPLAVLNRLNRLMDEQNVPTDNRWLVADPQFWEQMGDENSKLVGVDFTGDSSSILRNGMVVKGKIRNFTCYKSNNTVTNGSTYRTVLAGHMSAVATASAMTKTEVLRSQNRFADIIRGIHVFGRKVLRPHALALCYYTLA